MIYIIFDIISTILSLYILLVIACACFSSIMKIKIIDGFFDFLVERKINAFVLAIVSFLCVLFVSITSENLWIKEHFVSVNAIAISQEMVETEHREPNYDSGPDDTWTTISYNVVYEFEYGETVYQTMRNKVNEATIGQEYSIMINPQNPESGETPTSRIPLAIILIGGCLIPIRIFLFVLRKIFDLVFRR